MLAREFAMKWLSDNAIDISNSDFYFFGLWGGYSLKEISDAMNTYNIMPRKIFGFDSLTGLPPETDGLPIAPDWAEGSYNTKEFWGSDDNDKVIQLVHSSFSNYNSTEFVIIPGFFEDVLSNDLPINYAMKKAAFIDIDVDLYKSTIECLSWMIDNNLVSECLIYFDDWNQCTGTGGESLAFQHLSDKYNIKSEFLYSDIWQHQLFRISIGD